MHSSSTPLPHVNPTMELKNVANNRIHYLQQQKKTQCLLLNTLQNKVLEHSIMHNYVETHDTTANTQSYVTPVEKQNVMPVCLNIEEEVVPSTKALSFNEQVSEIIVLQDNILEDYLSVCNIRLRSHQESSTCPYKKEAADYMSILKALISN
jgi:hypothetical protein